MVLVDLSGKTVVKPTGIRSTFVLGLLITAHLSAISWRLAYSTAHHLEGELKKEDRNPLKKNCQREARDVPKENGQN